MGEALSENSALLDMYTSSMSRRAEMFALRTGIKVEDAYTQLDPVGSAPAQMEQLAAPSIDPSLPPAPSIDPSLPPAPSIDPSSAPVIETFFNKLLSLNPFCLFYHALSWFF